MVTIVADSKNCKGMQPEIMPGDSLGIELSEKTGENGIFLVEYKGLYKFCRLTTTACGKWLIFSNQVYHAVFVPVEELVSLKILGKLTKLSRSY